MKGRIITIARPRTGSVDEAKAALIEIARQVPGATSALLLPRGYCWETCYEAVRQLEQAGQLRRLGGRWYEPRQWTPPGSEHIPRMSLMQAYLLTTNPDLTIRLT